MRVDELAVLILESQRRRLLRRIRENRHIPKARLLPTISVLGKSGRTRLNFCRNLTGGLRLIVNSEPPGFFKSILQSGEETGQLVVIVSTSP